MSEHMAVDSDITKIVVYYDNGTEYVIAKGFVANIEETEEDGGTRGKDGNTYGWYGR